MRIFVKPAEGKTLRQPMAPYAPIPAAGFWQEDSAAWRRLAKSGDVFITTKPGTSEAPSGDAAAAPAKSKK